MLLTLPMLALLLLLLLPILLPLLVLLLLPVLLLLLLLLLLLQEKAGVYAPCAATEAQREASSYDVNKKN